MDIFETQFHFSSALKSYSVVRGWKHYGPPKPHSRTWVVRPDDLLVLDFNLVNLEVVASEGDGPAYVRKAGNGQAYLVVTFPPQHITEIAYFTTVENYEVSTPAATDKEPAKPEDPDNASGIEPPDDPPIPAYIAGWSRLAFRVPDDYLPFDYTLEGLLKAMNDLELNVPANALPPKEPKWTIDSALTWSLNNAGFALQKTSPVEFGGDGSSSPLDVIVKARALRTIRVVNTRLGGTGQSGAASRGIYDGLVEELSPGFLDRLVVRPGPAPPATTQTALEIPYRLFLSPNRYGAWFHKPDPATSEDTGHTELWHTRLGVRRKDGTLVDGDDRLRTLRAVWTSGHPPIENPALDKANYPPPHIHDPWRMSLDSFDRHNIVHLSGNFKLLVDPQKSNEFYEPTPLDVDFLALSALGGWLDTRGAWDVLPPGLSVEEWRHRTTLGRDHYVRVVYAGFLFPWGHRASVIKVTERQFHKDLPGNPAYLRQRMFLVVNEPLRTYRNSGLKYEGDGERKDEQYDLLMPFTAVRITTRVSPLLDRPEDDDIANKAQGCFWPRVGGEPFKFHLVATDTTGAEVEMEMPLIFVGKEETDRDHGVSIIPDSGSENTTNKYETDPWSSSNSVLRATVPLLGQKVALAESAKPDDTSFAVQSLTFGVEVPGEITYNGLDWREPRFFPVVRKAQIAVPSLQAIARTSQPASVVYAGKYLVDGFGGSNAGQVFLAADPASSKLNVAFSSQGDRSGGLITPDLELSGLSRITGPISGSIDTAAAGSFDPNEWFGAILGAKLFGVFALGDILEAFGFDELDKLPQFIGQSMNQVEQLVTDLERLHKLLTVDAVPQAAAVKALLDQLIDPSTGSIPALFEGGSVSDVTTQLSSLQSELNSLLGSISSIPLPPGPKALLSDAAGTLNDLIGVVLAAAGLIEAFASGDILPEALKARFEWRPELMKAWGPFKPSSNRNLVLAVEASGEDFISTCSLDDFVLDLEILVLTFEKVQLRISGGAKPEVDVVFTGFEFAGPLSFVETLREVIPFDGFSDPPDVEVTPEGITAGFTMGLPNLAVGVFSLENMSLGAGFSVPFIGPPLSVWFRFCERENPARLTVCMFGGGFYFGITMNADGLFVLEGAIEFGAAISVNFGVASGSVSAMAGLYFKIEGDQGTLAGYFRLRGEVRVLGIISVCIELYLELRYETASGKCVGTATISIEIDLALFSKTVSVTCTKKFAGANADPTLRELYDVTSQNTSADWDMYCAAFA